MWGSVVIFEAKSGPRGNWATIVLCDFVTWGFPLAIVRISCLIHHPIFLFCGSKNFVKLTKKFKLLIIIFFSFSGPLFLK